MASKSDGIRAVAALNVLYRAHPAIQKAPLSDELVATWRAAAQRDPDQAIEWWQSNTAMGSRLRKHIRTQEVAELFPSLPPRVAAERILYSEDELGEVAAKLLPRSSVVAIWRSGFDGPYEALRAWTGGDPLGAALRRHVGPDLLTAAWQTVASGHWGDALMLWKGDDFREDGLRHYVDSVTFRRLWHLAATGDLRTAAQMLNGAPEKALDQMRPLELGPLATSTDDYARKVALRHLERMINSGLPEPEDPDAFIAEWREIIPRNGKWAAKLILASPTSVRNWLEKADVATLLEMADDDGRLEAIAKLREQLRSSAPD